MSWWVSRQTLLWVIDPSLYQDRGPLHSVRACDICGGEPLEIAGYISRTMYTFTRFWVVLTGELVCHMHLTNDSPPIMYLSNMVK